MVYTESWLLIAELDSPSCKEPQVWGGLSYTSRWQRGSRTPGGSRSPQRLLRVPHPSPDSEARHAAPRPPSALINLAHFFMYFFKMKQIPYLFVFLHLTIWQHPQDFSFLSGSLSHVFLNSSLSKNNSSSSPYVNKIYISLHTWKMIGDR